MTIDIVPPSLPGGFVARMANPPQDLPVQPAMSFGPAAGGGPPGGFLAAIERVVIDVDARGQAASQQMAAVDAGQSDDLVGAMLQSQEASLSFSLLMQVRNKVAGAVDELVKLQV
jgi:flagellar hook-basal body complex protein FliE